MKSSWMVLMMVLFLAFALHAKSLLITWMPNAENDLDHYKVYVGTSPGQYGIPAIVPKSETQYIYPNVQPKFTYYVAVTAVDTDGFESDLSDEVSHDTIPPGKVKGIVIRIIDAISQLFHRLFGKGENVRVTIIG